MFKESTLIGLWAKKSFIEELDENTLFKENIKYGRRLNQ